MAIAFPLQRVFKRLNLHLVQHTKRLSTVSRLKCRCQVNYFLLVFYPAIDWNIQQCRRWSSFFNLVYPSPIIHKILHLNLFPFDYSVLANLPNANTVNASEQHKQPSSCLQDMIQSCIQATSIAPLQARYYLEALPTQLGYCVGVSRRSATGNCE